MKRFLTKVLLLTLLCCSLLLCVNIFVFGSQFSHSYLAVFLDKIDRLESIEEPKIILAGHSAMAFGICSEDIEKQMGMPVVNMGYNGALGNAFNEKLIMSNIGPGDIVVLSHSDFADDGKIKDCATAWTAIDCHFEMLRLCSWRDIGGMLAAYPTYFRKAFSYWSTGMGQEIRENTAYSRYAFNEYGDVVVKPPEEQMDAEAFFSEKNLKVPAIGATCVNRVNRLNAYVEQRGAALVIAGYPIAYGQYSSFDESDVEAFEKQLREEMDCDVISHYTDYMYPYRLFYDSTVHLTDEGTQIRTAQLIQDLKAWQAAR